MSILNVPILFRNESKIKFIISTLASIRTSSIKAINNQAKARVMETRRMDGSLDFQQLDKPAVMRKQGQGPAIQPNVNPVKQMSPESSMPDMDYLDIPAFLRKQEEV